MKKIVLAAAAAVALFGVPAFAMDSMSGPHNKMDATMMCRPAAAGEKPTAMMGTKGIVCKSMSGMMKGGHMGPDVKGMSAAQTDAAWRKWVQDQILIQSSAGTAGGNG
jgi:hypothetical protein